MKMPPSSCVYAAVILMTAAASVPLPTRPAPGPVIGLPRLTQHPPRNVRPGMTRIPKSYLVSGLLSLKGQTFLTGPNGHVVLGPIHGVVTPCGAAMVTGGRLRGRR